MEFCPSCTGQLALLGHLGVKTRFRCIACGLEFSHDDPIDDYGDVDREGDEEADCTS